MTGSRRPGRGRPIGSLTPESGSRIPTTRPPDANGDVIHAGPLDDQDLEHEEVGGPNRDRVVSGDGVELTGENPLGKLGQVESRSVPAGPAPEPRGDGDHGGTFAGECCLMVTRPESLGDGAEVGGYLRNVNVITTGSPSALPSGVLPPGEQLSR